MLKVSGSMVSGVPLAGRVAGLPSLGEACRVQANVGHGLMAKTTNLPLILRGQAARCARGDKSGVMLPEMSLRRYW